MAKSRIIVEYDKNELFSALAKLQPHGFEMLGARIVEQMLQDDTSFTDAIGLSVYGVENVRREHFEEAATTKIEIYEYAGFKYEVVMENGVGVRMNPIKGQHAAATKEKHRRAALEAYLDERS